jgi:hypothetical protein
MSGPNESIHVEGIKSMGGAKSDAYRDMLANNHNWLAGTIEGMTDEQLAWQPPGKVVPAGGYYVHVLISEDAILNQVLQGRLPLMATDFQTTAGFSEPMSFGRPWDDWARRVKVDLPAARACAQAVYASSDAYLAGLSDEDLAEERDFSALNFGEQPVSALINQVVTNCAAHCGEISAVKGLQGLKGYPF